MAATGGDYEDAFGGDDGDDGTQPIPDTQGNIEEHGRCLFQRTTVYDSISIE